MARVRRSLWVAAVACGVLVVSLMAFLGRKAKNEEKSRKEDGSSAFEARKSVNASSHRMTKMRYSIPVKATFRLSKEPRLGETVRVTYTITPSEDVPEMRVSFDKLKGVEVVSGGTVFHSGADKGETKVFSIEVRLVSSPVDLGVWVRGKAILEDGTSLPLCSGGRLARMIVDEETGQFGTWGEYCNSKLEFRYDPVDGSWLEVGVPGLASWNRRIIEMMRRLEPAISDSEALCLHSEMYQVLIPPEVSARWDEEKQEWIEDEIFRYYLQEGWLKAMREGRREDWQREQKEKIEREWERHRREEKGKRGDKDKTGSLLPGDSGSEGAFSNDPVRPLDQDVLVRFDGRWRFRKHLYDTTGLQTEAVTKDIISVKARILATYWYNSQYWRVYSPYATTNDTGGFIIQMDVPDSASTCNAYAVVFPSGPDPGNPRVNVSDPDITIPDYWKDPDDPTLFPCREGGLPTPHPFTPDTFTKHLGTVFPDSFPSSTPARNQPESGAVNIYETLLQAYDYLVPTYTTPGEIGRVRALWEPGYTHQTAYSMMDTIWVSGDTLPPRDTDEWDDGVLLHEYGHHAMAHCAQIPPGVNPDHDWWRSDSTFRNTAYAEGWPHFLRAAVTDSIYYVDTGRGIGGDSVCFYSSIENPWHHSDSAAHPFEGGPWCLGAVAGVLWDIDDSLDENPYPTYQVPGWPDTGLVDTLRLGFDEIWHVFDTYDPAFGPMENCWTIYHFLTGWTSPPYNYDYKEDLSDIVTHHRIPWDIPPAPTGLKAWLIGIRNVLLSWIPGLLDSDGTLGYNIYRREFGSPQFVRIGSVTDTSFVDTTGVNGLTYFYTVTALGSLQVESDTSNNEWIWIPFSSDTVVATAFNNADKIAVDSNNVHLVFVSEGKICYGLSENQAMSWSSPDTLGEGETPGLSLDIQGNPHVVWIGPDKGGSRYIYYARYDTDWHVDILFCPGGSPGKGLPLVRPYLPSLAVDPSGYGHVVWEERWITVPVDWRLEYAKFKTQNPDSIVVEQVDHTAMEDWYGSPSIALDCLNRPYVVYRRGSKGEIYYTMKDTAWTAPDSISESPSITSSWPCLDFCDSTLSVVWTEGDTSPAPDIFYRSRELDTSWDTIEHVIPSADFSAFPVIVAGTYVVWAESLASGPSYDWDIHGARRKSDGTREPVGDFPNIQGVHSRHPQAAFAQDADTGYLYVAWTEGDSAPFATMVTRFEVPRVSGFEKGVRAGVEEREFLFIPRVFALSQNYPNPCGEFTIINYQLPKPSHTSLKIYDVAGRLVRTLVDERRKAGYYLARWDGKDTVGEKVASGIYFYRLSASPKRPVLPALSPAEGNEVEGSRGAGYFNASKKMVVLR